MKFLCVKCDEPMKLMETTPPDRGSLTVLYSCPSCSHRIAMLTNPYETQLIQSMGVKIGPNAAEVDGELSKCPFSGMIREATSTSEALAGVSWTPEARARLASIPEFARPMAVTGIEMFARDRGYASVDEDVLDRAKEFFGM